MKVKCDVETEPEIVPWRTLSDQTPTFLGEVPKLISPQFPLPFHHQQGLCYNRHQRLLSRHHLAMFGDVSAVTIGKRGLPLSPAARHHNAQIRQMALKPTQLSLVFLVTKKSTTSDLLVSRICVLMS